MALDIHDALLYIPIIGNAPTLKEDDMQVVSFTLRRKIARYFRAEPAAVALTGETKTLRWAASRVEGYKGLFRVVVARQSDRIVIARSLSDQNAEIYGA